MEIRPSSLIAKREISALFFLFALPLAGQDAESLIKAQVDRVDQLLRQEPDALPNFAANSNELVKRVREALAEHRVFQSLENLAQLLTFVRGARSGSEVSGADSGLAGFEPHWTNVNRDLTVLVQQVRNKNWKHQQEGLRALVESALGSVGPLMAGSQGFAASGSPADGRFYLGQAQGQVEFAKFCATLDLERTGKAIPARSLLPELQSLQDRVDAAFVPPRSIDQHSRFIVLNSTLKTARELDAARSYAGALYQYLDAVRIFGLLDAPELENSKKTELKQKVASLRAEVHSSKEDRSIAEIFLERAESLVASGANPEAWRGAFVIAYQVIPAYFHARQPSLVMKRPSEKTVRLTLVRWPFT
jgi:hypothetical protein